MRIAIHPSCSIIHTRLKQPKYCGGVLLTSETCASRSCVAIAGRPVGENKDDTTSVEDDVGCHVLVLQQWCVYGASKEVFVESDSYAYKMSFMRRIFLVFTSVKYK